MEADSPTGAPSWPWWCWCWWWWTVLIWQHAVAKECRLAIREVEKKKLLGGEEASLKPGEHPRSFGAAGEISTRWGAARVTAELLGTGETTHRSDHLPTVTGNYSPCDSSLPCAFPPTHSSETAEKQKRKNSSPSPDPGPGLALSFSARSGCRPGERSADRAAHSSWRHGEQIGERWPTSEVASWR